MSPLVSATDAKTDDLVLLETGERVTDPVAGEMVVLDTDDVTPRFRGNLYEDAGKTTPYQGQGAEVRERLVKQP